MSDEVNRFADGLTLPTLLYSAATDDQGDWNEAYVVTVTSAAAKVDLNTVFASVGVGENTVKGTRGTFVSFQPRGGDVFMRMMHTSDATAAGVTSAASSTGVKVLDGTIFHAWVRAPFTTLDVISTSTSISMLVWKSNERPF